MNPFPSGLGAISTHWRLSNLRFAARAPLPRDNPIAAQSIVRLPVIFSRYFSSRPSWSKWIVSASVQYLPVFAPDLTFWLDLVDPLRIFGALRLVPAVVAACVSAPNPSTPAVSAPNPSTPAVSAPDAIPSAWIVDPTTPMAGSGAEHD